MNPQLNLLVVGKDDSDLERWQQLDAEMGSSEVEVSILYLTNIDRRPLSKIANTFLRENSLADYQGGVFGLCHADVNFSPEGLESMVTCAFEWAAVCGLVGVEIVPDSAMTRPWVWDYRMQLHKGYRWSKNRNIGRGPGPVCTLDSCSIFFRRDLRLRFDEETFDGLHCHVEDLCLQAQARGIPILVPPAEADHREDSTRLPEWQQEYKIYRARLKEKWKGTRFVTT